VLDCPRATLLIGECSASVDGGPRSCEKPGVAMPLRTEIPWSPLAIVLVAVAAASAKSPPQPDAAVFHTHCARCHGESGETDTPGARALKVRPLVGDAALARMTLADLVKAIRTNPKHDAVGALKGVGDRDIEAAARHAKELAGRK
jgi:mono/diheme cytochrome c family protein